MLKEFTCITCPRGCDIEADVEGDVLLSAGGAGCPKGLAFVRQELSDPRRNVASSVLVLNGVGPLASVRLTKPIPKERIADLLAEIRAVTLTAPVSMGQTVIRDVLGLGSDVIATPDVPEEAHDDHKE
jgi:CxxC motif-containing protein